MRRIPAGRNSSIRFIPTDMTDFDVTSTALVGNHPVSEVPLVDDGGLLWDEVSTLCPVQTILSIYSDLNDPHMRFCSRGPLVRNLTLSMLRDSVRYHWARLHDGATISQPGMFLVQQCYVHSILGRRVDFRSVPASGHGAHHRTQNLSKISLVDPALDDTEDSSALASSSQCIIPGSHVVLSSDDVEALASQVRDLISTYRREFDSTSDQVHLASSRASSSHSSLDDARIQLHLTEEHAT